LIHSILTPFLNACNIHVTMGFAEKLAGAKYRVGGEIDAVKN
jgi:hypothetical protein